MTPHELLSQLQAAGVQLTPGPEGTLACRAPRGVLTAELVAQVQESKAALLALVQAPLEPEAPPPAPRRSVKAWRCYLCQSSRRWVSISGVLVCAQCHPP